MDVAVGVTVQVVALVPAQMPPVQVNDVAAGVQVAESVAALPAEINAGDALRLQEGGAAPVWHASQFTPVAVFQAASMAATPLDVNLLLQRPATLKKVGGAGTGPANWLLLTSKYCNLANPLSDGIGPVSRLLLT